jgi:hypothetical protein
MKRAIIGAVLGGALACAITLWLTRPSPRPADDDTAAITQRLERIERQLARLDERPAMSLLAGARPAAAPSAAVAGVAPSAAATAPEKSAADPASAELSAEQEARREEARAWVESTLASGVLTESQRSQWHQHVMQLDGRSRGELTRKMLVALNRGVLNVQLSGPPF